MPFFFFLFPFSICFQFIWWLHGSAKWLKVYHAFEYPNLLYYKDHEDTS
jgi:hypothetical protein